MKRYLIPLLCCRHGVGALTVRADGTNAAAATNAMAAAAP